MEKPTSFCTAFIAPAFILYVIFIILPIGMTLFLSLSSWRGIGSVELVGFENYLEIFSDPEFGTVLANTGVIVIVTLLTQLPIAILLSYFVFEQKIGARIYRAVYFLPVVISSVAIGLMFSIFYSYNGPINLLLETLGLSHLKQNWLIEPGVNLISVMVPQIWQWVGWHFVIYLAALFTIPLSTLESAKMDGAGRFQIFWHIILPYLKPVMLVSIVLSISGSLRSFEYPFILTNGGPGVSTTFIALHMVKKAFTYTKFGEGSAIAVNILFLALTTKFIADFLFRDKDERKIRRNDENYKNGL